jgi:hypothetical protein
MGPQLEQREAHSTRDTHARLLRDDHFPLSRQFFSSIRLKGESDPKPVRNPAQTLRHGREIASAVRGYPGQVRCIDWHVVSRMSYFIPGMPGRGAARPLYWMRRPHQLHECTASRRSARILKGTPSPHLMHRRATTDPDTLVRVRTRACTIFITSWSFPRFIHNSDSCELTRVPSDEWHTTGMHTQPAALYGRTEWLQRNTYKDENGVVPPTARACARARAHTLTKSRTHARSLARAHAPIHNGPTHACTRAHTHTLAHTW